MKNLLAGLLLSATLILGTSPARAEGAWLTNYEQALAKAKQENKRVLMDFTGSDWCSWCMKLDKEVFSTSKFTSYAAQKLVLLKVDFPRFKHLTDEQQKANEKLAREFGIEGYPTVIILDAAGKKIGQTGYQPGGPEAFLATLEAIK